jgi:cysteine-rich repeat protein
MFGACTNTFIDLTPDSGDGGHEVFILPPPLCGDHVVDPGEECDDGNRKDGDGCTWNCRLGAGDPVPDPDPQAVPYVVEGDPQLLQLVDHPPESGAPGPGFPIASGGSLLFGSWHRRQLPDGTPAFLSARFLMADGSLAREDVTINLGLGRPLSWIANAARNNDMLLAWRPGTNGIWRAALSVEAGLAAPPALLESSGTADLPAVAGLADGYMFAWYDGTDTARCVHDGSGPSRIYLRRLTSDGTNDGTPEPVAIEHEEAAWTAPALAAGDDDTTGMLWWRASTEGAPTCTLRFGVADARLTTIADGGVVGPGLSGRIAAAEGAYQVAWRTTSSAGTQQLGFASFDGGALLLAPPVLHDMPFGSFAGDVELAAGDHGLLAVVLGYDLTSGLRLFFLRTDLLGRAVGVPTEVDPSCTGPACTFGPFNVVWGGDAFLVIYFVTLDLGEPTETTEMRMVRLVPAT